MGWLAKWYIESFVKFVSYHMVHKDFQPAVQKYTQNIFLQLLPLSKAGF